MDRNTAEGALVYLVYFDDGRMVITKKAYRNWREIQDEYWDHFQASLGPWTLELLLSFLDEDFGPESDWPFSKKELLDFFESDLDVLYSN